MPNSKSKSRRKKEPKRVLALPDLDQAKMAVLNSLTSASGQRTYDHAIREFVAWYFSEPRLAFIRTVVLRYRIHLEQRGYAPATIHLRLAAVRRIAYEAADAGLLSPELAAGIRRVKGVRRIGVRLGNWLTAEPRRTATPEHRVDPAKRGALGDRRSRRQVRTCTNRADSDMGEKRRGRMDGGCGHSERSTRPGACGATECRRSAVGCRPCSGGSRGHRQVGPAGGAAFTWTDSEGNPTKGTTIWSVGPADGNHFAPSKSTFMLNYRVENLAALVKALREEGCNVLEKTDDSEYGKFGWVMDPEGNKVELWQPPQGQ